MISSILIMINSCNRKNYSGEFVIQNLSQDNHVLYFLIITDCSDAPKGTYTLLITKLLQTVSQLCC